MGLLTPSINSSLKAVKVDCSTPEYGYEEKFIRYEIVAENFNDADYQALNTSVNAHARACAPAPNDVILKELAAMRILTKGKAEDSADRKFTIAVYAEKLAQWPGDVVLHVLRTQPSMCKWWPSWSDLEDRLELYGKKRMKRHTALVDLMLSFGCGAF